MSSINKSAFHMQAVDTITKHSMFKPGDSVLVCVSGGADSVALLAVLTDLKEKLGIHKIHAFHVNHKLRQGAKDDEVFVQNLCEQMSVPLEVLDIDVRDFAAKNKKGLEEAGRIVRHKYAKLACKSFGADKIAMGHNMGDNAETVILNLCRGAGPRGMMGIPPINGNVVRPLINTSKEDILLYLEAKKQPFVTDQSNFTNDFARNRVRNTVLPLLESSINSNAVALIARSTELFSADEEYLNKQAAECFAETVTQTEHGTFLDSTKLNKLHFSISSRIIRTLLTNLELTDISLAHVRAVLELSAGCTGKKFIISNIHATKEYDRIVFSKTTQTAKGFSYYLKLDEPLFIPDISKTIFISLQNFSNFPAPYCTKLLKYDIMPKSVVIRTRLAGDRICLSSKGGRRFTKKLQDFFTDAKIPKSLRDEIPILTIDEKIAWLIYNTGKEDFGVTSCDFRTGTSGMFVTIWEGNYAR